MFSAVYIAAGFAGYYNAKLQADMLKESRQAGPLRGGRCSFCSRVGKRDESGSCKGCGAPEVK
jgi:hypothetical protein